MTDDCADRHGRSCDRRRGRGGPTIRRRAATATRMPATFPADRRGWEYCHAGRRKDTPEESNQAKNATERLESAQIAVLDGPPRGDKAMISMCETIAGITPALWYSVIQTRYPHLRSVHAWGRIKPRMPGQDRLERVSKLSRRIVRGGTLHCQQPSWRNLHVISLRPNSTRSRTVPSRQDCRTDATIIGRRLGGAGGRAAIPRLRLPGYACVGWLAPGSCRCGISRTRLRRSI